MRFLLSVALFALLAVSAFAQDSSKYLKVDNINFYGNDFSMMKNSAKTNEIGGDSTSPNKSPAFRDSTTTKQISPTESQLEDRNFNNYSSETSAKVSNNQYLSVRFTNLSGKAVKSVTFLFRLSQNGKKVLEKNVKGTPRLLPDGKFYLSENYFSSKNFAKLNAEKEVFIKRIEFADGTKLKF